MEELTKQFIDVIGDGDATAFEGLGKPAELASILTKQNPFELMKLAAKVFNFAKSAGIDTKILGQVMNLFTNNSKSSSYYGGMETDVVMLSLAIGAVLGLLLMEFWDRKKYKEDNKEVQYVALDRGKQFANTIKDKVSAAFSIITKFIKKISGNGDKVEEKKEEGGGDYYGGGAHVPSGYYGGDEPNKNGECNIAMWICCIVCVILIIMLLYLLYVGDKPTYVTIPRYRPRPFSIY